MKSMMPRLISFEDYEQVMLTIEESMRRLMRKYPHIDYIEWLDLLAEIQLGLATAVRDICKQKDG